MLSRDEFRDRHWNEPLRPHQISLLAHIALGLVVKAPGGNAQGGHYQLGEQTITSLELHWLAQQDLIDTTLNGDPRIAPRGERILREMLEQRKAP